MQIHESGSNYTVIQFNKDGDDVYVLISYKTAVATNEVDGFRFTEKKHSATTTRHIRKFLNGASAKVMEQEYFDNIINTVQV